MRQPKTNKPIKRYQRYESIIKEYDNEVKQSHNQYQRIYAERRFQLRTAQYIMYYGQPKATLYDLPVGTLIKFEWSPQTYQILGKISYQGKPYDKVAIPGYLICKSDIVVATQIVEVQLNETYANLVLNSQRQLTFPSVPIRNNQHIENKKTI